jgi:sugar/nucleoside kinase (ribokinase family)
VKNILEARSTLSNNGRILSQPIIVWEPVPDLCVPDQLAKCKQACQTADIISPNDGELLSFFGEDGAEGKERKQKVEQRALELLKSGIGEGGKGAVVVRAGKDGCYGAILENGNPRDFWLPPFHQDSRKVVDPTGGGNGFLGGFAIGFVRSSNQGVRRVVEAAVYGSVAASFCIEQVGVPVLEKLEAATETWNGDEVLKRLNEFQQLCEIA